MTAVLEALAPFDAEALSFEFELPEDLVATVYHHLGIQPHDSFPDQLGRPIPVLMRGQVIRELVG